MLETLRRWGAAMRNLLRESLRLHRRSNAFLIGILLSSFVFFTVAYYLILRNRDLPNTFINNRVLLIVLRNINALLVLTILFILLRNLFKLWVERRSRILGSKFKTKLVMTYIGLSLIPVVLLFVYATELLQGSIENLFQTPVGQLLDQGNAVSQALIEEIQDNNQRDAGRIVREIAAIDLQDISQHPELSRRLQTLMAEMELDLVGVYEDTEFVSGALDPRAGFVDLPEPGRSFLLEAIREGAAHKIVDPPNRQARLILGAAAAAEEETGPATVVVAGTVMEALLTEQTSNLVRTYQTRRQLEVQQPEIKASYLLLFLMITLVILLFSSWMGLYLAKRVTVPIQALADGTRRIMSGDLEHRVEAAADDELGVLVHSFNRMTEELQKNKELLERSNKEMVETNRRLAEERALIGAVLENVAAGVLSIDREGVVFTCNGAALAMLRQKEKEVVGKPLREVWHDPERSKLLGLFDEQLSHAGQDRRQVRLVLGGEWKTFEAKITTMRDEAGELTGHVLVLEDLTELLQAQQLATWNEAARRIAHEIKNPLTPIKLSAERLLMKYRRGDPHLGEALEDGVGIIVREVGAMKAMVDEFSRFARMPRPRPSRVDLEELVEETIHLYRDIKTGLDIAYSIDAGAKKASLDREQMRSVLINLLDNAVQATDSPGEITVSAHRQNGALEITIVDTGPGIPAEAKEKLFLPYYSTKGRGSGLGLAIAHRIISDHHGSIRVEDNRPRGTVFTIELPQA